MKTTTLSVDGTFIVIIQHYVQDLLTTTETKTMDQGKKKKELRKIHSHNGHSVGSCDGVDKG